METQPLGKTTGCIVRHTRNLNPLIEKTVTPSSDSQTLTLDNLRLWTLPIATLGSIPSDIP